MRRLLVLASTMVLFDVAFYSAIAPLLPDYVDELGLSKAGAGILSAAYAAGTLIASLPAGLLASRVGPRRTVLAGLGLLGLSSLVFGFGHSIGLLDAARFSQGVAGALIWSGALTWLITTAPPERRGSVIGTRSGHRRRRRSDRPGAGGPGRRSGHRSRLRRRARDRRRIRRSRLAHARVGAPGAPDARRGRVPRSPPGRF